MLKRRGLDDTQNEQLPTGEGLSQNNVIPRNRLTGDLDYGLMDDLSSGRDSFFSDQGQVSKPVQESAEKCPGFANQHPVEEHEEGTSSEPKSSDAERICRDVPPRRSIRSEPLVDFGAFEPEPSRCGEQICGAAGPSVKRDSRPIHREYNLSCDSCASYQQRSNKCDPGSSSMPGNARQCVTRDSQRQDTKPEEPTIEPEAFSNCDKIEKRLPSWSQLKDHKFVSNSGRVLSHILAVSREFLKTKRRTFVPALAGVLLVLAFLYLAQPRPYSVETRLMFISGDGRTPDLQGWSLDKETKYFSNTNVVYTLAQKLFEGHNGPSVTGKPQNQDVSSTQQRHRKTVGDGREKFKNQGEFIRWFIKVSSLEADTSSVPARITLKLTGNDPKFLKAVSENYVRSYVEFRRAMPVTVANQINTNAAADSSAVPPVLKTINERLQTFDIQEREYELALNLIDSGKSHFAGFIPKESMVEATSLAHFQQKIVQLELHKNALSLKYAPESREIRTVEAEIQAARKAMRQCLVEQLRFVKHNRELLLTQKMELEKGLAAPPEVKPERQQPVQSESNAKRLVSTDAPVPLGNGLYLIWDKPILTEKPLLSKVGDATGRLVAGVQQSIDSVRDAKDSVITGLYNTLVSDNARGVDSDVEDDQSPQPSGRHIVRQ